MHELTLRKVLKSLLFPLLAASLLSQTALAQSDPFPAKSIRIIASTSPGGLTDLLARNLGRLMSESLGQQVVVENRPGAGTLIGMTACARAPADGYTLCLTDNQSLVFNPLLFSKLPYDPKGDFVPIGGVVRTPNDVIVASPTLPANNLAEVLALARAKPGTVSFATWGTGSLPAIYYAWITRQGHGQPTRSRISQHRQPGRVQQRPQPGHLLGPVCAGQNARSRCGTAQHGIEQSPLKRILSKLCAAGFSRNHGGHARAICRHRGASASHFGANLPDHRYPADRRAVGCAAGNTSPLSLSWRTQKNCCCNWPRPAASWRWKGMAT